jgi:hypothetical protein
MPVNFAVTEQLLLAGRQHITAGMPAVITVDTIVHIVDSKLIMPLATVNCLVVAGLDNYSTGIIMSADLWFLILLGVQLFFVPMFSQDQF